MRVQVPGTERKFNRNVSTSYNFDALTPPPSPVIQGVAGFQIVVQRIELGITVDAAETQTFETDDLLSPQVICKTQPSPGTISILFDFGECGFVLNDGASLVHTPDVGASEEGSVVVQAFLRPTPNTAIVAHTAGVRGRSF